MKRRTESKKRGFLLFLFLFAMTVSAFPGENFFPRENPEIPLENQAGEDVSGKTQEALLQPNAEVTRALKTGDVPLVNAALLRQYQDINPDTVGIIRLPGTVLDHPLMQSSAAEAEEFYLYHDLLKRYNAHGTPFLSKDSVLFKEGGNSILYGHNIRIGTQDVFAPFSGYERLDFYREHPALEIVTNEGTFSFLVIAYYLVDTSDEDAFVYWETTDLTDPAVFEEYMRRVEERNWLVNPTNRPVCSDTFLTLSSCSVELARSGTNRMVVMARRCRDGENIADYAAHTSMNPSPKLPARLSE